MKVVLKVRKRVLRKECTARLNSDQCWIFTFPALNNQKDNLNTLYISDLMYSVINRRKAKGNIKTLRPSS
jgi:hypothetical protein